MESKCHKTTYNHEIGQPNFDVFSERQKLQLTLRTQIKEILNICYDHKQLYLMRYATSQRKCADPFKLHKKASKGITKLIETFISNFSYSHVVIFAVEIELSRIVISSLLNYFAKLLFRKKNYVSQGDLSLFITIYFKVELKVYFNGKVQAQ